MFRHLRLAKNYLDLEVSPTLEIIHSNLLSEYDHLTGGSEAVKYLPVILSNVHDSPCILWVHSRGKRVLEVSERRQSKRHDCDSSILVEFKLERPGVADVDLKNLGYVSCENIALFSGKLDIFQPTPMLEWWLAYTTHENRIKTVTKHINNKADAIQDIRDIIFDLTEHPFDDIRQAYITSKYPDFKIVREFYGSVSDAVYRGDEYISVYMTGGYVGCLERG